MQGRESKLLSRGASYTPTHFTRAVHFVAVEEQRLYCLSVGKPEAGDGGANFHSAAYLSLPRDPYLLMKGHANGRVQRSAASGAVLRVPPVQRGCGARRPGGGDSRQDAGRR